MNSIVKELADWTKENVARLSARGVRITEKFPEPGSAYPWKANIALMHNSIAVSFTVWERTIFQTELIVMNAKTGRTLVVDEKSPSDSSQIRVDLDGVVQRLLSGFYHHGKPDPKLVIS